MDGIKNFNEEKTWNGWVKNRLKTWNMDWLKMRFKCEMDEE